MPSPKELRAKAHQHLNRTHEGKDNCYFRNCLMRRESQWGGFNKKKAGRILNGRTYDEMPPRVNKSDPIRKECLAMMDLIAMGAGKD